MVKNLPAMLETWVQSLGWEDSPGGGHGNPFQYSCLDSPHGQRSLGSTIFGVTKSRTRLSDQAQHIRESLSAVLYVFTVLWHLSLCFRAGIHKLSVRGQIANILDFVSLTVFVPTQV